MQTVVGAGRNARTYYCLPFLPISLVFTHSHLNRYLA